MSSKAKWFKIGERAVGGIIEVIVDKGEQDVTVRALDWDSKQPLGVGYDESTDDLGCLERILWDWTDSYHAEEILIWVAKNGFNEASEHFIYGR